MAVRQPVRITALIGLLLLVGCAQVRVFTYPNEFVYLDEQGVQDAMHELADGLHRVETLIYIEPDVAHDRKRLRAIDGELDRIEAVAAALGLGARLKGMEGEQPRTAHLLIDEHVDEFLTDVARARRTAALDPPNLYAAGRLAGSCTGCHRFRKRHPDARRVTGSTPISRSRN